MIYSTDAISVVKVIEVPLRKNTSHGKIRSSGITIKFAVTVEMRGDMGADELQATDAVTGAIGMVSVLRPTPQIVGLADSAVNTNVVTELQTFENTWGVLLQRMDLFNRIVAGIAEVSDIQRLAPSPSECGIDSSVCVAGLVCDIGCESGLSFARHSR